MQLASQSLDAIAPMDAAVVRMGASLQRYRTLIMACSALVIGLVSAYDLYLTVATLAFLPELEVNPIARRIVGLDEVGLVSQQRIAAFLGLKFAGTVAVIVVIQAMAMMRHRLALPVTLGVLAFQIALLFILTGPMTL